MILTHESVSQEDQFYDKKIGGKKSRGTIPLNMREGGFDTGQGMLDMGD
jgi:hypothetical protein